MAMTNRERVGRGLEHLARGLAPFVDAAMKAAAPAGRDWLELLVARDRSRFGPDRRHSLNDPQFLLRVVTEERRVFRERLSHEEQRFASELRDARNKWAHGDDFTGDDAYRVLDTIERLLNAVKAPEQATEVRALRLGLQPGSGTAAKASEAASPPVPPSPPPPSPVRPARTGIYWSRLTRTDIVRAIEEYDRLGQDRFLDQHGFGRATGYLLIYNGRSYDSKAIAGVAYGYATGVPLASREFSGGVNGGAADVLRKLGFDVHNVRDRPMAPSGSRPTPVAPNSPAQPFRPTSSGSRSPGESLGGIDPERCLLVITCSGSKETGGRPPAPGQDDHWTPELLQARERVLATSDLDADRVLPAWRRYTGTFYRHARPALADAVAQGHVVILSGGYGLVRAEEPIGWYDRQMNPADWPRGLLETALAAEATRRGLDTVVAFASSSTGYATVLRRTAWQRAGLTARLVTITGVTGGAMVEVPRRLGQAFGSFWQREPDRSPPGTTVEHLG